MKKLASLLIIFMSIIQFEVSSQVLPNTTWHGFDLTGNPFTYFQFGPDTLFISGDNVSYQAVSTYNEVGSVFHIMDLPTWVCPNDIGQYNFSIVNDTLTFTLITDNCTSRPVVFVNRYYIRLLIGIDEIGAGSPINLYPNPTTGVLNISFEKEKIIRISTIQGQLVRTIETSSTSFSISDLPSGIFFVSVYDSANKYLTTRKILLLNTR